MLRCRLLVALSRQFAVVQNDFAARLSFFEPHPDSSGLSGASGEKVVRNDASARPLVDLEDDEELIWKMAAVKGFFRPRVLKGYLITSKRCFVWDAVQDGVEASLAVGEMFEVAVKDIREIRAPEKGGGRFVRNTGREAPPPPGERASRGDIVFTQGGRKVMVFPGVVNPEAVKALIEGLRAREGSAEDFSSRDGRDQRGWAQAMGLNYHKFKEFADFL